MSENKQLHSPTEKKKSYPTLSLIHPFICFLPSFLPSCPPFFDCSFIHPNRPSYNARTVFCK